MENKIEALFDYITEKKNEYYDTINLYGVDDYAAKNMLTEIKGMGKAFKVIAEHSYADHLLTRLKKK